MDIRTYSLDNLQADKKFEAPSFQGPIAEYIATHKTWPASH